MTTVPSPAALVRPVDLGRRVYETVAAINEHLGFRPVEVMAESARSV